MQFCTYAKQFFDAPRTSSYEVWAAKTHKGLLISEELRAFFKNLGSLPVGLKLV